MNFNRIFDILLFHQKKYPNPQVFNDLGPKGWNSWSIGQLIRGTYFLADWLRAQNYPKASRIAFIPASGQAEWIILDLACQMNGLITVPIHQTIEEHALQIILTETQPVLCLCALQSHYHLIQRIVREQPFIPDVFHTDTRQEHYFPPIRTLRQKTFDQSTTPWKEVSISPQDLATIIYTSGTTGKPKGVMLSHENIVSNIQAIMALLPLNHTHRVVSFLPLSHIFERVACFTYLAMGVSVYFGDINSDLSPVFKAAKPHFCTAVPRILEKRYDAILSYQESPNFIKRILSKWLIKLGQCHETYTKKDILSNLQLWIAKNTIFRYWHYRLGGQIKWIAVGSAAMRPEISRFFCAMDIHIREGYGMTETSPVISFNRFEPGLNKFGSVGIPIPGIQVVIKNKHDQQEGEIYVKGPNVMMGYYQQASDTAPIIDEEGWLKTGDIGYMDNDHFLFITDRAKDIFKTSSGKFIAPQRMQQHFESSPFIQQCLYIGFNRPYPTALLVINFELMRQWANTENIHWTSPQYMVHNIMIKERIDAVVQTLNARLPVYKRIRKYHLCHEEWTIKSGAYSSTLKLVRSHLLEKYAKEINEMYPEYIHD